VYLDSLNPDPAFQGRLDPDPGFWRLKIWRKKIQLDFLIIFFWSKIAIYFFLGLNKGSPSCRRSIQHAKKNIQHFNNLLTFFYFCGSYLPSWIWIHNADFLRQKYSNLVILEPNPLVKKQRTFVWFSTVQYRRCLLTF
jgi:hypothetical protein